MLLSKENITLINLLILQQCFGAGSIKAVKIFNILRENNILDKEFDDKRLKSFIEAKDVNKLASFDTNKVFKIIDDCVKNNIKVLTIYDADYPERLKCISDSPLILYIKGDFLDIDNLPLISIVGPRKISDFGKKAAYSLGKRLAKSGMIIVSGAALGADTCAHKGTLSVNGKTIAVLGCGICYDYLPENRELRNLISNNGCLVSEYPPFAPATKYSFPIRNRIISALSLGTVVIEASLKSGSLITARLANEQGRDVFVIPGNPILENYKGSNALLRDGAIPLLNAIDIFNQYLSLFPDKIDIEKAFEKENDKNYKKIKKNLHLDLSNEAKIVYNNLNNEKFTVDDLLNLNLSDDALFAALTELEIEGVIKALPGGMYEIFNN
ncbi:MAG: DNA-protecting protein DprA [Ruminococcaceae bacterium]|nr:DNA-protecting protein DprA [Oscillospiraceae bacterium]